MESAVVLAMFTLIAMVVIYVVFSSSTLQVSQTSKIEEKKAREDLKLIYETAQGMYRIGWSSNYKKIGLQNEYTINITENSITLSYGETTVSEAFPVPLVPKNISRASSLNLSYVVYAGSGHINISKS